MKTTPNSRSYLTPIQSLVQTEALSLLHILGGTVLSAAWGTQLLLQHTQTAIFDPSHKI